MLISNKKSPNLYSNRLFHQIRHCVAKATRESLLFVSGGLDIGLQCMWMTYSPQENGNSSFQRAQSRENFGSHFSRKHMPSKLYLQFPFIILYCLGMCLDLGIVDVVLVNRHSAWL